jgi:hypothetical protein
LASTNFIVLDEDTGELLIRAHLRRDGVYLQPNIMRAALAHLPAVQSSAIRRALFTETVRIIRENIDEARLEASLSPLSSNQKRTLRLMAVTLGVTEGLDPGVTWEDESKAKGSKKGSPKASRNPSRNPLGDRGQGNQLGSSSSSLTLPHEKRAGEPAPTSEQAVLITVEATPPWGAQFAKFWAGYPRKRDQDAARRAFEKLVRRERVPAIQLIQAARNYADSSASKDGYAKYPATFLNSGGWRDYVLGVPADERIKPGPKPTIYRGVNCPEHPEFSTENCPDCLAEYGDARHHHAAPEASP